MPSPLLAVQLFSQFPAAVREKIAASRMRLQQLESQIAAYDPQLTKKAAVSGEHKAERVKLASLVLRREMEKQAIGKAVLKGLGGLAAKGLTRGVPAVAKGVLGAGRGAATTAMNATKATAPHLLQAGKALGGAVGNAASAVSLPAGSVGQRLGNVARHATPGVVDAAKSLGRATVAHPLNTAATTTAALRYGDKAVNATQGMLENRRVSAKQNQQAEFDRAKKQQMAKLQKFMADSEAKAREAEQLLQQRKQLSSFVPAGAGVPATSSQVAAPVKKKMSTMWDKLLQNSRVTADRAGEFLQ